MKMLLVRFDHFVLNELSCLPFSNNCSQLTEKGDVSKCVKKAGTLRHEIMSFFRVFLLSMRMFDISVCLKDHGDKWASNTDKKPVILSDGFLMHGG
jgi:hypothetical protein